MTILDKVTKKPELIFITIGSFFGLLTVFLLPVLTAPDEGAHFWMSYGMFSSSDQVPKDLLISGEAVVKYVSEGSYIDNVYEDRANLEGNTIQLNYNKRLHTTNTFNNNGSIVSITDISHIPQAFGVLLGSAVYPSLGSMVILGRLFNLGFFLITTYFIIKHLRFGKLAFSFIALFPMIIHQVGSVSYDSVNIVLIFAWMAMIINLSAQKIPISRKQFFALGLLAIALLLTKRSNAILLLLPVFLPTSLYKDLQPFNYIKQHVRFRISRRALLLIFSLLSIFVAIVAGVVANRYLLSLGLDVPHLIRVLFNTAFRPEVNTQLDTIVGSGIVGNFGWLWYRLPGWLVFLQLMTLVIILLGERLPRASKTIAIGSACIFVLSVTGITLGMYFMWTLLPQVAGTNANFIQGVQGRYFTPLLVLLVPVFAYLRRFISIKIDEKLLAMLAVLVSFSSLTIYIVLTLIFFYTPADGVKDILLM